MSDFSFPNYGYAPFQNRKELDFFWWEYDDGSEAGAAIDDQDDEEVYAKTLDSRAHRKAFQNAVKARSKKKDYEFEKNRLTLDCGLKQVDLRAKNIEIFPSELAAIAANGKTHVLRMLEACGQDLDARTAVLTLFSALLSGYYVRFLADHELFPVTERFDYHAPILACSCKDGAGDFLRSVVSSVGMDTSEADEAEGYGKLNYFQPNCLPQSQSDRRIIDCAYIKLLKSKKKYFDTPYPAQYRDTCVYLNARFFPSQDLFHFQQRNPWAAMVFYGIRDQSLLVDPIRLEGKVLARYSYGESWNEKHVHQLVVCFLDWLKKRLKGVGIKTSFQAQIRLLDSQITQHNQKRGSAKIRGLKKIWLETQLLALEDFTRFGVEFGCWSEEEGATLLAGWKHLLLPTIFAHPLPQVPPGTPGRPILPEHDCMELFQQTLSDITARENWDHFVYVPSKEDFPLQKGEMSVWGYIRAYQDRKAHQTILTLQIREKEFVHLAEQFSPIKCNWYEILDQLRKKEPSYLHASKTTRMPGIGPGEKTLILKVNQLDFLPHESLSFLLPDQLNQ